MPHAGGGSSGGGGGFHSSSSGTSSIPKTDFYGHTHSHHYYRPGYYYGGIYVPYSRVHRGFHAISRYFIFLFVAIFLIVIGIFIGTSYKSESTLEDYSLNRYSQIYEHDSSYEKNVLVEVVAYDNLEEVDYFPIVGNDINIKIDETFGNQKTVFGGYLESELDKHKNKVENLYSCLAISLEKTNNTITKKYYDYNSKQTRIINNTSFNLGNADKLNQELNTFYELTGYNIVIDVNNYNSVYKPNYTVLIIMVTMGSIFLFFSIYTIVKASKAVKFINEEDKKGNLKQYFEGEVDYETHVKRYSMDEPLKFDRNEYEKFKKECEQSDDFKKI